MVSLNHNFLFLSYFIVVPKTAVVPTLPCHSCPFRIWGLSHARQPPQNTVHMPKHDMTTNSLTYYSNFSVSTVDITSRGPLYSSKLTGVSFQFSFVLHKPALLTRWSALPVRHLRKYRRCPTRPQHIVSHPFSQNTGAIWNLSFATSCASASGCSNS